jgi:hypothetical protein
MGSFFSNPTDQCIKESNIYQNKGSYSLYCFLFAILWVICIIYVLIQPSGGLQAGQPQLGYPSQVG